MKLRNRSLLVLPFFALWASLFLVACSNNSVVTDPSSQQSTQQTTVQIQPLQVTIVSPDFSGSLKSPVTIKGKVSGLFYFEGTFPIVLLDAQGKVLATTVAHADDDWMTENDVPFTAELTFKVAKNTQGMLVFKKDNPSGLSTNDFSESFAVILQ